MKRIFILCGLLALTAWPLRLIGQTTDDERLVRQAVQDYFAAITDHDAAALERAFHPDAVISSYLPNGRLYRRLLSEWRQFVERDRPEDADQYQNRIVSVDIAGTAASVKTDLIWPRVRYIDYLSLLKVHGTWKIVNKIWYEERPSNGGANEQGGDGQG